MRNLLSSNFSRLRKTKSFWFCMIGLLLTAVLIVLNGSRQAIANADSGYPYSLEHWYYDAGVYFGIFAAAAVSLYVGTEHSDGTLRNKIIIGHSRVKIYLANFITCACVCLLLSAAWMLGGLTGIPYLGTWRMEPAWVLLTIVISLLTAITWSSIFSFICLLFPRKDITAVASILLAIALVAAASFFYNRLCEPELSSGLVITIEGMQMMDPTPNPNYVSGMLRTVYTAIVNILPPGQAILLANIRYQEGIANYVLQALSSIGITGIVSIAGIALFCKEDLK